MDLITFLLLLLGGCAAGLVAGYSGVGAGIIIVPLLLVYYKAAGVTSLVATHLAFGTSLFVVVFGAALSVYRSRTEGHVLWRTALIMGCSGVLGAAAGSLAAGDLPESTLKRIFGALVLLAAFQLFTNRRKPGIRPDPPLIEVRMAAAGAFTGSVSALGGIGGGVLFFPFLYSYFLVPLKKASDTSGVVSLMTAAAASAGYLYAGLHEPLLPPAVVGFVDPLHALPLILGALPCFIAGASLGSRSRIPALQKMLGVFLVVMALKMLLAP